MKYTFKSNFADDINSYIQLRTSLGNQEETFARRLHSFDEYCILHYPQTVTLTQEMCEGWCVLQENESLSTLRLRTGILRDFSKYLNSIGRVAYIMPEGFTGRAPQYLPYIYTDEELAVFFESVDSLGPHKLSPYREYVVPVLFRMLYCCGLRPQELPPLTVNDVNIDSGIILIYDSKRHKDRVVPMSSDLQTLCREYNSFMETIIPDRTYFFQCKVGTKCSVRWIQSQFHKCWKRIGMDFPKNHHPRVYDFRHNHATRVIRNWMDEGKDVMSLLPYLSSYMGHESIEYTTYYVHLVPEYLSESGKTGWETGIEVPSYEK